MNFLQRIKRWLLYHRRCDYKSQHSCIGAIFWVTVFALLAVSYISGIPKAYLASLGVTEEVSKGINDIKVEFESVTLSKCSIGSSVSCSWIYGDSVELSTPKLNDIKHGLFGQDVYAYPSFPLEVGEKQEGRIVKCGLLYDNKPADCGVYLHYDWGLPVLYAQVDSGRDEEKLGIASGRVRFNGLRLGKTYVFDGRRLDVREDGTAVELQSLMFRIMGIERAVRLLCMQFRC